MKKQIIDFCRVLISLPALARDLAAYKAKVDGITSTIDEMHDYLKHVSSLADYVQDTDAKQAENLKKLIQAREYEGKSREDLQLELQAVEDLKLAVTAGQAVGRVEIQEKNHSLMQIETTINQLRQRLT